MKIGFFDSGLGGLTILRAVVRALPQYDYVYYGDTAHLPYGDRDEADIYQLTSIGMRYLFEQECALVIIACNTASAETARRLQNEFLPAEYPDRKILGVIVPTIETLHAPHASRVALLATKRTVDSDKYQLELTYRGNGLIDLTQLATPELAPLIEQNKLEEATELAVKYIRNGARESETIVLGCTHYTEIKDQLRVEFPEKTVVSQDEVIPEKLQTYLANHPEIETTLSRKGTRSIYLTEHRPDYDRIMGQLLGGA